MPYTYICTGGRYHCNIFKINCTCVNPYLHLLSPPHLPNRMYVTDTNREEKAHVYLDAIIDLIRLTLKFVSFGHQDIISFFLNSTHQEPIAVILHAVYSRNNQIKLGILHPVNQ